MSEFFAMGGYGAYVWSSYALGVAVLLWNLLDPMFRERRLLGTIARRQRRERRKSQ